jgi:hypothetical protein
LFTVAAKQSDKRCEKRALLANQNAVEYSLLFALPETHFNVIFLEI